MVYYLIIVLYKNLNISFTILHYNNNFFGAICYYADDILEYKESLGKMFSLLI